MVPSAKRILRTLLVFLLCMAICWAGHASEHDTVLLGPMLSGLFETDKVISISTEYKALVREYGDAYHTWPYDIRERISNSVSELAHLPDSIMYSRTPDQDDLDEAEILDIAWEGMLNAYPISEKDQQWYINSPKIAFGTMDFHTSYWWVHYSPAAAMDETTGSSPMDQYTVQIDRTGKVTDVNRTGSMGTDPTMSPLQLLFIYASDILSSNEKPVHLWTDEEKLDLNVFSLFPHLGAIIERYGSPSADDLAGEEAVSLAKEYIQRVGDLDQTRLNDAVADVRYLIGEASGNILRPFSAYPLWHIRFAEVTGAFLCRISIDPKTGALVEYSAIEMGYIPVR